MISTSINSGWSVCRVVPFVRADDLRRADEDDITLVEIEEADPRRCEDLGATRIRTSFLREVDLRDVAGDDGFEPKPRRVRNIFICSGVVFCASSRMMNESLSVRRA